MMSKIIPLSALLASLALMPLAGQDVNVPSQQASNANLSTESDTASAIPAAKPSLPPNKMGDLFMARKMYREAVDSYKEALASVPVLWNKMGIAYHQLGELDTAKRHYEQAIGLDSKYAEAINNLGAIYYAKRDYKKAEREYRKALRISPNSASIHSNLGTALFARKKYDKAMESYQQAMSLDPEIFEHRATGGSLLQERSIEERATYHFYLAKLYAKAGSTERALLYMRMSLEEGFQDRKKYEEEPEFAAMRDLPEFQELLAYQPRVL
jgi:tetratricopeptide (TPR) repeat protein